MTGTYGSKDPISLFSICFFLRLDCALLLNCSLHRVPSRIFHFRITPLIVTIMNFGMQSSISQPVDPVQKVRSQPNMVIIHQIGGKQRRSSIFNDESEGEFNSRAPGIIHSSRSKYYLEHTRHFTKPPQPEMTEFDPRVSREPRYIDDSYIDRRYHDKTYMGEGDHALEVTSHQYGIARRDHYRDHAVRYMYGRAGQKKYQ